jgi:hypothetical protein
MTEENTTQTLEIEREKLNQLLQNNKQLNQDKEVMLGDISEVLVEIQRLTSHFGKLIGPKEEGEGLGVMDMVKIITDITKNKGKLIDFEVFARFGEKYIPICFPNPTEKVLNP